MIEEQGTRPPDEDEPGEPRCGFCRGGVCTGCEDHLESVWIDGAWFCSTTCQCKAFPERGAFSTGSG